MSVGALLLAGLALLSVDPASVPLRTVPLPGDSCVDHVSLKGGPRLLGAVLGRRDDGTALVAVSRDWLRAAHPEFLKQIEEEERERTRRALTDLQTRIDAWLEARAAEKELVPFLKAERTRVDETLKRLDKADVPLDSQFVLVELPERRIERIQSPSADRRQLALLAWREQLPEVEKRTAGALRTELKKLNIHPDKETADLADRLPVLPQDEGEWAARVALAEYQFREPCDFQGQGDLVLRTGAGAKPVNTAQLLQEMLQSHMKSQLGDLFGGPPGAIPGANESTKWLESAERQAEEADVRGFRVTRVTPDLARQLAIVETRFVARFPSGEWFTAWRQTVSVDPTKVDKDAVEALEKNPQLAPAFELAKSLGAGGDDHLRQALRFGAATQQAQKDADAAFFKFRDRNLQHLDGPAILPPSNSEERPPAPAKKGVGTSAKKGVGRKKIAN